MEKDATITNTNKPDIEESQKKETNINKDSVNKT